MWGDLYGQIASAKTVDDLRQAENPGLLERIASGLLLGQGPQTQRELYKAKLDELQRQEAAPIYNAANNLIQFAAADPQTIGSVEGLRDIAARPDFWLGTDKTGVTPGGKAGGATVREANPRSQEAIQALANYAQQQADLQSTLGSPELARLAANKELSQQYHYVTQGVNQQANTDKLRGDVEAKDAAATDLSQFQREIAGLNGGTTREQFLGPYADPLQAVKQIPVERDPQGRTYVRTDTGALMPFEELTSRVQQAYANNPATPREVVKNLMDDLRLQYENSGKTTQGTVGRTTYQKFDPALGKPQITKEDVQPAPPRISITNGTTGTPDQVQSWVAQLRAGNATLSDIPARGQVRTQVVDYLTRNHPEVNLTQLRAGKKWAESAATGQTLSLIDATGGILNDMRDVYKKLNRTDLPGINYLQSKGQEWSGNADFREWQALKNYGIQEVEKVMSGSGAMSDHRVKLAFEALTNSNTQPQFERAYEAIKKVLSEREKATRQGPFPGVAVPIPQQQGANTGGFNLQSAAMAEMKRRGL